MKEGFTRNPKAGIGIYKFSLGKGIPKYDFTKLDETGTMKF